MAIRSIVIEIYTENAAFEDLPSEVSRILRGLAQRIENEGQVHSQSLRDINGNTVGAVSVRRPLGDFKNATHR